MEQLTRQRKRITREKEQATREKEQATREKELVTREKEQATREKELVTREKEQLTREKERIERDLQLRTEESQQVMRENQQLQTANTQSQQQVQQLSQQVSDVIVTSSLLLYSRLQLSVMSIAEGREEQPHWVVRREEVELTEEVLGRGGWGEVKVAKFRGLRVAAKFLHDMIISEYNEQLFSREMTIAAKIRHPNLLLFIGATREGEAVILTELMPTSLRRELQRRVMEYRCATRAPSMACSPYGSDVALCSAARKNPIYLSGLPGEQQQVGVADLGSDRHFS